MMSADAHDPVVSHLETTLGLSFEGPRRARLLATIDAHRAASRLTNERYEAALVEQGFLFDTLVAEITVGETSFFRDRVQCDLLRHVVFPELADRTRPHQPVALWSAGCASGEEAITLAAMAAEAGLGVGCFVVGSDVCASSLEQARRAEYGAWSMRSTTTAEKSRFFYEQDGRFHVRQELRRRVTFVQRNLLEGAPPPGLFEIVLCRNLLIYLNRAAVKRAAAVLSSALAAHGWLITAAGDPPLEAPGLEAVRTSFGVAYRRSSRKPAKDRRVVDVSDRRKVATSTPPQIRPIARGRHERQAVSVDLPAPSTPASGAFASDNQASGNAASPTASTTSAATFVERVRSLGDAGRLKEACHVAAAAVRAHPLDVELRYLEALVLLEAGRVDEAAGSATSAVYIGPDNAATHVLLGQVEHARGNIEAARRSFRNGSRLLATAPSDAPVELLGDLSAGHLRVVAGQFLDARGSR